MNIEMRHFNLQMSEFLHDHILRQVEHAVRRFRDRIGRITVRLTDVNGPRGGIDKRCRITAELIAAPPLVVESESDDAYDAVGRAASRLHRTTARMIGRRRHKGREHAQL
jgi:ribosomal subunit interface protein